MHWYDKVHFPLNNQTKLPNFRRNNKSNNCQICKCKNENKNKTKQNCKILMI